METGRITSSKETGDNAQTRAVQVAAPAGEAMLKIFVYGTLKRGYWNHERFCQGVLSVEEAIVRGRLYELPSGIPVLQVRDESIIATGTRNALADVETQCRQSAVVIEQAWELPTDETIHGELFTFDAPAERLPPIDRLEGFRPHGRGLYQRALVPVLAGSDGVVVAAWAYVAGSEQHICSCKLLPTGRWEHDSHSL